MIARRGNQPAPKIAHTPDRRRAALGPRGDDRPAGADHPAPRGATVGTGRQVGRVPPGRHAIRTTSEARVPAQSPERRGGDDQPGGTARVTSAAPHCGVSRSWKKGRVSSDIAGCPFRCHRISGGSKDTTSSTANRQHDLPRHAQQRSLGSQWHSGPMQPRPPTSGRLRPAQRRSDLRRCDTTNSAQPPLARCQRPARQTLTDTSRKILEKTSYSPHKRRPRHASDQ